MTHLTIIKIIIKSNYSKSSQTIYRASVGLCPGVYFFLFCSTIVPGSGRFQLSNLAGLGYAFCVRVLGIIYHNRFPNPKINLNHNPITLILR